MSNRNRSTDTRGSRANFRKTLATSAASTASTTAHHSTGHRKTTLLATTIALGLVTLVVIGFALMITPGRGGGVANASGGGPAANTNTNADYGSLHQPKGPCGNTGQAPCAPINPGWFSIASASPADVATAIAQSDDYTSMQSQFGYVSLDTPTLVHAYDAHTGNSYYDDDHWVVSVRNAAGMRCGIFDFVYDRSQQRLRFSSFGVINSPDPHSHQAFPYILSSLAIAQLQNQRKLGVMTGTQPELIFFPIDPSFPVLTSPTHKWAGGGNSAMNPMWLIVGSDGQSYFVGTDLNVHTQKDLPIAKGQP